MVDGVIMPPALPGSKGENTGNYARDLIGFAAFKKRTMPAIVENDEGADHEARRGYGQR